MSGFARKVAVVAGVVALAATGIGAGLAVAGYGAGLGIAGVGSFAAIASTAGAISGIASFASGALAKAPPARGSVSSTTIGTDQPIPYLIGETYYGGSRVQQVGYGPTIDKVPNPYALLVDVYSGAGPVQGLVDCLADFVSLGVPPGGGGASGYAGGFLWAAVQRGAMPESAALAPRWAGAPGWGSDYRLSGYAAIAWSLLFDRKGQVFVSGPPQLGSVWQGQLAWDPRQDGSLAGGMGPQRWAPPSSTAAHDAARATWTYNECPGLQGLRYALGAWHRDPRVAGSTYQKVAGVGLPIESIIVEDFVHLANVCDANGWKVGGIVFEPATGSASVRWQNLKDILAAGGAEPYFRGGRLGVKVSAPRIALDTITVADVADDEIVVCSGVGWEDRLNTLIPKYRSRDHKWEYVASMKPVAIAEQVAIDGEIKRAERQINLCQWEDQAAQLCAYELFDRREIGEIEIVVKPRLRKYGPGDLLIVDLPEDGLAAMPCVVLKRQPMPDRMVWKLTLRSETLGKHAFALGQTAVAPPIPALRSTADLDGVAAPVENASLLQLAVATSFPVGLTITAAADGSIAISDHVRRYTDGHADVVVAGATIATGLAPGSFRAIGYDDPDRLGLPAAPSPTNLLASPRDLGSGAWGRNGITLTGGQASLDGLARAWLAVPAKSGVKYMFSQANGGTGPKTVSIVAKAAGYHHVIVKGLSANGGSRFGAIVDLSNGTVVATPSTGAPTGSGVSVTPLGDSWYLIAVTQDTTSGFGEIGVLPLPSGTAALNGDLDLTAACDGTSGVLLDFARIDQGSVAGRPSAYRLFVDDIDARASPTHPGRHYLGYAVIPTAGSPPSEGGGATPPGGRCVTVDTPLLTAPGRSKPAGEIVAGVDRMWTRHEGTLEWGFYRVEAALTVDSDDVWAATIGGRALRATGDHLVYTGAWVAMRDLPGAMKLDGTYQVVKLTVTSAHTYVSNGILSHNIKPEQSLDPAA